MKKRKVFLFLSMMLAGAFLFMMAACDDDEVTEPDLSGYTPQEGSVSDVEGNEYKTLTFGNQEWMAENLKTTTYADGSEIATGLNNPQWGSTEEGAYAIYDFDHGSAEGVESEEDMWEMYGVLYNWHAVNDDRGLCPDGWRVPTNDDWSQLVDHLKTEYDITNEWDDIFGLGNYLKSCRQIESPLGGNCATEEHPRWASHTRHYGSDSFGFNALSAGSRVAGGAFNYFTTGAYFWSSSEYSMDSHAWSRRIFHDSGFINKHAESKQAGYSVRCIKE